MIRETPWTHDLLAADLLDARHLVGEIAMERLTVFGGVVDVAAMQLSWTQPRFTAYEVKVSRADLLSDLRSGKWRKYLSCVERLYYALSPDVEFALEEIPIECGVTIRSKRHSWRTLRKPQHQEIKPLSRARFVQALLFRHYPVSWDGAGRTRGNVRGALKAGSLAGGP